MRIGNFFYNYLKPVTKGYKTFFAGKWHLGGKNENSLPTNHGFDENQGGYEKGGPYSGGYFSPFNNPNMKDYESEKGMSLSMKLANETSRFIIESAETNFLAYLSFYAVHSPIETTQDKWQKYRNKAETIGIHEDGFAMEKVLPARRSQDNPVYAGLVEQVDDAVGSVMQTLKNMGLEENTVVIFTSDNGGVVSGDNFSTNSLSLRGGKGYQWEGGTRVPFFIHVPWMHNKGAKNSTPVSAIDLYPTVLDLAGVGNQASQAVDGLSLLPLLKGEKIKPRKLYWHYPHYGNQGGEPHAIIRDGTWKLIHYWEDGRDELYNLESDLKEQNNLSEKQPQITKELQESLLAWLEKSNAKYPLVDTLWSDSLCRSVLEGYKTKLLIKLERQRKEMLDKNWKPNDDWWGSKTEGHHERTQLLFKD